MGITYYSNGVQYTLNVGDPNYIQADPFQLLTSPFKGLAFPLSTTITLAPRTANFSAPTLGNTTHTYASPQYTDIIALSEYFADWGMSYKTTEGATHIIQVEVPWDTISQADFSISQYASEIWEIVDNEDAKSIVVNGILANPFANSSAGNNYVAFPDVIKVAIQQAFENKMSIITIPTSVTGSAAQYAPFLPYAQQVLNYLRGGVESVPSHTQTLKRTAVIDNRNSNGAFQTVADSEQKILNADGTVNFLLSTPDLINKYSVLDNVTALLYPSYQKQITVTGIEPAPYFSFAGWLVSPPSFQFITQNKVQITQLFRWNEYLAGLYYINSSINDFPIVINPSSNPSGFIP